MLKYDEAKAIYMETRADVDSCEPAIPNFHLSTRESDSWLFRTQFGGTPFNLGRVFDDGECKLFYREEEEI